MSPSSRRSEKWLWFFRGGQRAALVVLKTPPPPQTRNVPILGAFLDKRCMWARTETTAAQLAGGTVDSEAQPRKGGTESVLGCGRGMNLSSIMWMDRKVDLECAKQTARRKGFKERYYRCYVYMVDHLCMRMKTD